MGMIADGKTFAITQMAHVPRLSMAMNKAARKVIAPAVMIGCGIAGVTVISFVLYQGYYGIGSYNFGTGALKGIGNLNAAGFGRLAVSRVQEGQFGTDWTRVMFMVVGGGITALLYHLRYRFTGFPLHPIGFTISAMVEMQDNAFSIFLIWAIKSLILKIGGWSSIAGPPPSSWAC
jgi:hypothetical protein